MALITTEKNGTQTPEQMAKDIVKAATEDKLVEISGTAFQRLDTITRYDNRDKIQGKGENWFIKNHQRLVTDSLDTLIRNRDKALRMYLEKKDNDDRRESFLDLVARGMSYKEACDKTGYNPDLDKK